LFLITAACSGGPATDAPSMGTPADAIQSETNPPALRAAVPMALPEDPLDPSPTPYGFATGPESIGTSVEGRPLEMYRFGYGPLQRLIVGGIHGGYEWNTIALARELIAYLGLHPGVIPTDVTLFVLPALNPDGEARSHSFEGRTNAHGADLSRNWDSHWQADWRRGGCWNYLPTHGGTAPGSEPEVAALLQFFGEHEIEGLISYHSAALGIFPGGRPPDEDSTHLAEALAAATGYPYPPLDTGCLYTGQFTDWASDQGIAAADVELANHRDTDFEINLRALEVFLAWRR
jgi:hypothetical protein